MSLALLAELQTSILPQPLPQPLSEASVRLPCCPLPDPPQSSGRGTRCALCMRALRHGMWQRIEFGLTASQSGSGARCQTATRYRYEVRFFAYANSTIACRSCMPPSLARKRLLSP